MPYGGTSTGPVSEKKRERGLNQNKFYKQNTIEFGKQRDGISSQQTCNWAEPKERGKKRKKAVVKRGRKIDPWKEKHNKRFIKAAQESNPAVSRKNNVRFTVC